MERVRMGLLDWAGRDGKALDGMEGCMDMGFSQWVHQDQATARLGRALGCDIMGDALADEDGEA